MDAPWLFVFIVVLIYSSYCNLCVISAPMSTECKEAIRNCTELVETMTELNCSLMYDLKNCIDWGVCRKASFEENVYDDEEIGFLEFLDHLEDGYAEECSPGNGSAQCSLSTGGVTLVVVLVLSYIMCSAILGTHHDIYLHG